MADVPEKDLVVVLDANVLIQHKRPSTELRILGNESARGSLRVCVPELVVQETSNHHRLGLLSAQEQADSAIRRAEKIAGRQLWEKGEWDASELTSLEDSVLRARLKSLNVELVGYPEAPHDALVRKAILRVRPFDEKGSGYRDALLWEIVLNLLDATTQVVLVSNDKAAFSAVDDKDSLHPHLAEEASGRGGQVELCRELRDVVDQHVPEERRIVAYADELINGIETGQHFKDRFAREAMGSAISLDSLQSSDLEVSASDLGIDADERLRSARITHASVGKLGTLGTAGVWGATPLDAPGLLSVAFEISFTAILDLEVRAAIDGGRDSSEDQGVYIEEFQEMMSEADLVAMGDVTVNQSTGQIMDMEIYWIVPLEL